MKNIIVLLTLLTFAFTTQAQSVRSRRVVFDGTIGKAAITAIVEVSNAPATSISGEYLYNKNTKNERISISEGKISNDYVIMRESYYDTTKAIWVYTGYFSGKMANWLIEGIWTDPAFNKVYPFSLTPRPKYLHRDLNFNLVTTPAVKNDDDNNSLVDYNNYLLIKKINITDKSGNSKQTIDFKGNYINKSENPMRLEDLNFDGYLDLVVEEVYPGVAKGDWGQLYYVYNPQSDNFEHNDQLTALGIVNADPIQKVVKTGTADGRGNETNDTYVYNNGNYLITRHEETRENDDKLYYIDYKIVNGKSVEQSRSNYNEE